jgi:hypothetical protein
MGTAVRETWRMSACEEASTGGFRLGSRLGGSSDLNLLTDLDHHQVFAEF